MDIRVTQAATLPLGEWWEYEITEGVRCFYRGTEQAARDEAERVQRLYKERVMGGGRGKEVFTLMRRAEADMMNNRRARRPTEDFTGFIDSVPFVEIRGY